MHGRYCVFLKFVLLFFLLNEIKLVFSLRGKYLRTNIYYQSTGLKKANNI